jgi:hypothetical protein
MKRDRRLQRALDTIKIHGGFMGAAEVAEVLGVEVANLKWQKVGAIARISRGKIPVYLAYDVEQELKRRGRKAAASE